MKHRNFKLWIVALLAVCLIASLALVACDKTPDDSGNPGDGPKVDSIYYLSVDGATYNDASSVPAGVKFAKSDDVYKLTAQLEKDDVVTVKKVGSTDVIGYDSLFSTAGKLTQGNNNAMVVAEDGTFAFTLDVSDDALLTYSFTKAQVTPDPDVTVVSVEITTSVAQMFVDDVEIFVVTVTYSDTTTSNTANWSSSNEDVATVDGGVVTALTKGTTEITASIGGQSDSVTLEVVEAEQPGVQLDQHQVELALGDKLKLNATLTGGLTSALLWNSSNNTVATVDQSGNVEATGYGTAIISVTTAKDSHSDECVINVAQHVVSISLGETQITLTEGGERDLTVTFNPVDATNKDYTVVVADSTYVTASKSGTTLTLKGEAVGSTTVTVTSDDNPEATATLTVNVVNLTDAKPYLSQSTVEVDIEASATVNVLWDGGDVTSFTTSGGNTAVATVTKDTSSITVTGVAYGTTTLTVTVTYGNNSSETLTLTIRVATDFYYLTGTIDGTSWATIADENSARSANMLLEKVSDGIYEITREIDVSKGAKFYILPSNLDTNWNRGLKNGYYTAQSNAGTYGITTPDADNVQVSYTGVYTIRLDITGSKASWTVIVVSVYPTGATVAGNTTLKENDVTSTELTLTIAPNVATVTDIAWSVEEDYKDWLSIETSNSDKTCTVSLVKFDSEQDEVTITITIVISYGDDKTLEKTQEIKVLAEGGQETAVDHVQFDKTSYVFDVANGWNNLKVSATAYSADNGTPTNDKVTYSIIDGGSVKYNGGSSSAFAIDSESGLITALFFGTIRVRATSDADSSKYADIDVVIYSSTLIMAGAIGDSVSGTWSNNPTIAYSSINDAKNIYTWTNVEMYVNNIVVFMYDISDWDKGMIRSGAYLDSSSTSGAITPTVGTSSNDGGQFTVKTRGVYTVTLDISGATPVVKFEWLRDVEVADTWSKDITIDFRQTGSNYQKSYKTVTETVTNEKPTISVTIDFTGVSWPTIQFIVNDTWLNSNEGVNITGDAYKTTDTSGYWCGVAGSSTLWYNGSSATSSYTFIFTFDASGVLTDLEINAAQ